MGEYKFNFMHNGTFYSFLSCFFPRYSELTGPVSMGSEGELCKEYRFWHGELASSTDVTETTFSRQNEFSCVFELRDHHKGF